jgi:hypothetical protein
MAFITDDENFNILIKLEVNILSSLKKLIKIDNGI